MKLHPLTVVLRGGGSALGAGVGGFVFGNLVGSFLPLGNATPLGGSLYGVFMAVLFASGVFAYHVVYYRRFEYDLTDSTLDIRSGVLSRRERDIPLGRVQNVDIKRTIVVRVLGLAAINVETAGGGSTEAQLRYVEYTEAKRLQEEIRRRKRRLERRDSGEPEEEEVPAEEPTMLFELDDWDLIRYSVLSFDPRVLSILFFAVPSGFPVAIPRFETASGTLIFVFTVLGALLAGVGIWLTSALARFVRFYGFTLHRVDDELRYERGLLQRYDGSIPLGKIQTLAIEENVLMRHFDLASLSIETAGYAPGSTPSGGSEAAVPLANREQLVELARSIEPFDDPDLTQPVPRARRRYAIRYALVGAVVVGLGVLVDRFLIAIPWYLLFVVFLGVPVAARKKWIHRGYALPEGYVVTRNGFWRRTTRIVPDFRIQTVIERQTVFQRRWGLGSVIADTAGAQRYLKGDATAYDLDGKTATTVRDRLGDRLQDAITGTDDEDSRRD
ncbi:MAG: PH domain-containing protein [Halodesulfurarchaeum sp.]